VARAAKREDRPGPLGALRVVVIILMAAAIATLGLLRGGGQHPEARAEVGALDGHFDPLMPRYPRVAEFPMGEELGEGDGAMRMSYFSTEDSPLRVARFYQTTWEQEGLSVHQSVTPQGGVVGTYDPRIKAARSVTIFTKGRLTWVFPATVDRPLGATEAGDLGEREGLPVYPGSSKGLTLRTTDQGRASVVTSYSNDGGLAKNLAFYREQMASKGWREREAPAFDELGGHRLLDFDRDGERCSVNLTPLDDDERRVVVSVILEGADD
jgi:hypothetical protein